MKNGVSVCEKVQHIPIVPTKKYLTTQSTKKFLRMKLHDYIVNIIAMSSNSLTEGGGEFLQRCSSMSESNFTDLATKIVPGMLDNTELLKVRKKSLSSMISLLTFIPLIHKNIRAID